MPERLDERPELCATLRERGRDVGERLLPPGADLDLGRDQLADQVRLEGRLSGRFLHLLEAVRQVERLGIEKRELLLDCDREVRRRLELLARARDQLVG